MKIVSGKNFRGDLGKSVGEKPAVVADDNFQFTSENFGLRTSDFRLPIVRRGLRDARDIGKREILRDDRAPAVRAEFDVAYHGGIQTFKSASAGSWALTILRIFLTAALQVALAEQAGAAHESVRAGAGAFGGGLDIDAAVHADAIGQVFVRAARLRPAGFWAAFRG